ncbi:MAG TPA: rhodanese-like domain-containing protein [Thermoanaerobaculia bacterium]|nr:rhodanese-like domain-containing protein [Thermoanaerobaculia bacterium]
MNKIATAAALSLVVFAGAAGAQYKPKGQPKAAAPAASPTVDVGNLQRAPQATEFRRISREDAYKLYQSGQAVFIDVRSHQSFTQGHIKGALSIPGSQLISRFGEVTPGKMVITYCACGAEESSGAAVNNLTAHGVKNAAALKGGWAEWKAAGLPMAAGPK